MGAAALLWTALLSGCSTYTGDALPHSMGGLPANAPERPAVQPFPAVHDMPAARPSAVLTDEEQRKAEKELEEARDRQPGRPKAKQTATKDKAKPKTAGKEKAKFTAATGTERSGAGRSP